MTKRLQFNHNMPIPVNRFFNVIHDVRFVAAVKRLVERIDYSFNDVGCYFSENVEVDEGDDPFDGVKFSGPNDDDEVVITEEQFQRYLREACDGHIAEHPKDKSALGDLLRQLPQQ